jgi:hypothetical protein
MQIHPLDYPLFNPEQTHMGICKNQAAVADGWNAHSHHRQYLPLSFNFRQTYIFVTTILQAFSIKNLS